MGAAYIYKGRLLTEYAVWVTWVKYILPVSPSISKAVLLTAALGKGY